MEKYIQYNPTMSNNGCVLRAQQEYIYVQRTILTFPEDCSALELHTFTCSFISTVSKPQQASA